jgi:hypothetical protein
VISVGRATRLPESTLVKVEGYDSMPELHKVIQVQQSLSTAESVRPFLYQ